MTNIVHKIDDVITGGISGEPLAEHTRRPSHPSPPGPCRQVSLAVPSEPVRPQLHVPRPLLERRATRPRDRHVQLRGRLLWQAVQDQVSARLPRQALRRGEGKSLVTPEPGPGRAVNRRELVHLSQVAVNCWWSNQADRVLRVGASLPLVCSYRIEMCLYPDPETP